MKTLMQVRGVPVNLLDDGSLSFVGAMTIDADGSPHAYGPPGVHALDYLANAGHPGNWWGIVTIAGKPVVQTESDPAPGFYVSTTSYERREFKHEDPRRYLDSETERFIVVPGPLRRMVGPDVLGCHAVVVHLPTRKEIDVVVGDIGPATHLGEASIAVAKAFGVPSAPKTGGIDKPVFLYKIFPGVAASGYHLQPA